MFVILETVHGTKIAINSQHIVSVSGPTPGISILTLDVFTYDPAIDGQKYRRIEVIGDLPVVIHYLNGGPHPGQKSQKGRSFEKIAGNPP